MSTDGYRPVDSFGPAAAAEYDRTLRGDEAETVACLARLAGPGPALELAIGTGRIALPLAATGMRVEGIELSEAMVARLRSQPGGEAIRVTVGDMAAAGTGERYPLVYLVYNTIKNLLTQDEQVACFANAAAHLTEDGVFLIEAYVPTWLHRLERGQYVDAEEVGLDEVSLDVSRYDAVTQLLTESHVRLSPDGIRLFPIVTRQVWPAELDLMARLAGLRLRERWGGWAGEPFDGSSARHVSVYGR